MFDELDRSHNVEVHWLVVNAQAMKVTITRVMNSSATLPRRSRRANRRSNDAKMVSIGMSARLPCRRRA